MSAPIARNSLITKVTSILSAVTTPPTKGTPTTDLMTYMIQDQVMHLQWTFTENTGSAAGSGIYLITIPASLVIDGSFVNIGTSVYANVVGSVVVNNDDGAVLGHVTAYNSTSLAMVVSGSFVSHTNLNLASAKEPITYSVKAVIPITNRNYLFE